jgi:hypothetical protein
MGTPHFGAGFLDCEHLSGPYGTFPRIIGRYVHDERLLPLGAPATVINAVVDALADLGVTHVDMPASPSRIWEIVNDARIAKAPLAA